MSLVSGVAAIGVEMLGYDSLSLPSWLPEMLAAIWMASVAAFLGSLFATFRERGS